MSEANGKRCSGSGASPGSLLFRTILIDPPWPQALTGKFDATPKNKRPQKMVYPTMAVEDIAALPIADLAAEGCHLWLWTTNQFLRTGFDLMDVWGFTFLAPVTWVKPSGIGAWFVHRTQTVLFGYKDRCEFNRERYKPTVLETGQPKRHSQKPEESYELIEAVSDPPRVELFARPWSPLFPVREGWEVWGNEVRSTVTV